MQEPLLLVVHVVGMEVADHRLAPREPAPEQAPDQGKGQHAEVDASGDGHRDQWQADQGERQLPEPGLSPGAAGREAGPAVHRAASRQHRARVAEAELRQHLVGPGRLAGEREHRGPEALDVLRPGGPQIVQVALQVLAEALAIVTIEGHVVAAVATDLVSRADDPTHELRVAAGDVAHREERAPHVAPGEELEVAVHAGRDPIRVAMPVLDQGPDVLEVDAEQEGRDQGGTPGIGPG